MSQLMQESASQLSWRDVSGPTKESLHALAEEYGLHATSLEDCMDPGHLPKFETIDGTTFVILRAWDETSPPGADTITSITRKVALFVGKECLLSIHRQDLGYMARLRETWQTHGEEPGLALFSSIAEKTLDSFRFPLEALVAEMETLEADVFLGKNDKDILSRFYSLKRRAWLIRRLIWMDREAIERFQMRTSSNPYLQECMDTAADLLFLSDDVLESTNGLISLHLSLASHRTNEVMRILTIFSVFFLPLTFIAGIYGMNFQNMPELSWRFGYPLILGSMILTTGLVFFWFRHRGWLR